MKILNPALAVEDFFLNNSLYDEHKFTNEGYSTLSKILGHSYTLDSYCVECEKESVFKQVTQRMPGLYSEPENLLEVSKIYTKTFYCSRSSKHNLLFIIKLHNSTICKIGQYPSIADLAEYDVRKFMNILGVHYIDFKKAIGLFSHGIGIGSYVYLRRIIENFILKPAIEKNEIKEGWDKIKFKNLDFKGKIQLLKADLPEFLINNTTLYSILSKGIHDMTEDECIKFFPVLKNCLTFVLTEMKAKQEEEKERLLLEKSINKIHGDLS